MPVILEQITKPSPDDLKDLIAIYQDYPYKTCPEGENSTAQWIESKLSQQQHLLTGRFNGRLITAIWATITPQGMQLHDLCVRGLTRRRGVARQFLTLIAKQAQEEQQSVLIDAAPTLSPALPKLLSELGFTEEQSTNSWSIHS